jgi:hypothetical protein
MKPKVTMREALTDPNLLGNALPGDTWRPWRILLIAAMGEALTDDERVIFKQLTGRDREPGVLCVELVFVVGRRGGKSRAMSVLAAYLGGLCDHPLVPGERGVMLMMAPDQRQAKISLDYAAAVFEQSPILKQLVDDSNSETIRLKNRINLEVRAASWRRLRGPTYIGVIADECSFFHSDETSANADKEILDAVRPGLGTTNGMLVMASSPYSRRGELWETYRKHYGPDGDPTILVAKGTSREFNSSLSQSLVDRALERDYAAASAEYLAEFRTDLESFVPQEVVNACVGDHVEMPRQAGKSYYAFVDPSGGSADGFTLAISHREGERVFVDCVREIRPPFSPEGVVEEFAGVLKTYRVGVVRGDRYAGEWPREQFKKRGISYVVSDKTKSDLYRDLLPLLNSGLIVLPKNDRLISQLSNLERRVSRSGKDSIDHPPGFHDDVANAVAGAIDPVMTRRRAYASVGHYGIGADQIGWNGAYYVDYWGKPVGEDDPRHPNCKIANPQSQPCLIRFDELNKNRRLDGDGLTADDFSRRDN